jgi:hypothetical protein
VVRDGLVLLFQTMLTELERRRTYAVAPSPPSGCRRDPHASYDHRTAIAKLAVRLEPLHGTRDR